MRPDRPRPGTRDPNRRAKGIGERRHVGRRNTHADTGAEFGYDTHESHLAARKCSPLFCFDVD